MQFTDMLRRSLICLAIIGIAFSIAIVLTVLAKADQEQTKPEQPFLAAPKPLDAKTDVPRCWHRGDEPTPVIWFRRVGEGVILVVRDEIPSKVC